MADNQSPGILSSLTKSAAVLWLVLSGIAGAIVDHSVERPAGVEIAQVQKMIDDSQLRLQESRDHEQIERLEERISELFHALELQQQINAGTHWTPHPTTQECQIQR